MRIKSLEIKDFSPIKYIKIDDLWDLVIIAGANGSGKSRLRHAIIETVAWDAQFMSLVIEATTDEEKKKFWNDQITIRQGTSNSSLHEYIDRPQAGWTYSGGIIQVYHDGNIGSVNYNQVDMQGGDPDTQPTPVRRWIAGTTSRWKTTNDFLHQKTAIYKYNIADEVEKDSSNVADILSRYPDPIIKYKEVFSKFLIGKELQDIDIKLPKELKYKDMYGNILPFRTLSSWEQEVIQILFGLIRNDVHHCIIIVDEPELHLHPNFAFQFVEALKLIGNHTNQLIFLTHSADLISTYYETWNVYFIDSNQGWTNQAHNLLELSKEHSEILSLVRQNLGIFSVGKRIIFVEGEDSSIDRLVYSSIAQVYAPGCTIVPVWSVDTVNQLNNVQEDLSRSIFWIEFYMIRDRDWLSLDTIQSIESKQRIMCLKRRHIENYFLDTEVILKIAQKVWTKFTTENITIGFIESKLLEVAEQQIKLNMVQIFQEYIKLNHYFDTPSKSKDLAQKDVKDIQDEMISYVLKNTESVSTKFSEQNLRDFMVQEEARLKTTLVDGKRKSEFRGKNIFVQFCESFFKIDHTKVRELYINIWLQEKPEVFHDIIEIFKSFNL